MIRNLEPRDIYSIKEIHEKFYKEQFNFSEFNKNYLCQFVAVNDNNQVITAGGIRLLAEAVLVTDKNLSPRERIKGLKEILLPMCHVTERYGLDGIHAFIQEPDWESQLKKIGFKSCKGNPLYYTL